MKISFTCSKLFLYVFFCLVPLTSQSETIHFMAFGDSITQGDRYVTSPGGGRRVGGYEPHLEYLFTLVGRSAYVYNWGLGGETTQQALDGGKIICTMEIDPITGEDIEVCDFVKSRKLVSALASQGEADYFLLMEGTNDFFSGITPWKTATNIGLIIDAARSYNMEPIVATITPDQRGLGKDIEYRNILIKLTASDKGVEIVDMYNGLLDNWGSYVSSDNLHPNAYGYEAMAMEWFIPFYNIQLTADSTVTFKHSQTSVIAVLNGSATANGDVFGVAFEYGIDETSMSEIVQAIPESGSALGGLSVTAEIEGLEFDTKYYYRMISTLDGTTFYGDTKTFTNQRTGCLSWLSLLLNDDTE